jgi:pimeloyl-ACP methyl ester carboxylesterase
MNRSTLPSLQSVEISGRTIAWREAGQGDPLVLVHGIGGFSGSWQNQIIALSDAYRVIAWDAPGYGGSSAIGNPAPNAEDYAAALAALLRHLQISSPHLVGHSLGSIMIASLCRTQQVAPRSITFLQPVTGSGSLPDDEREKLRQARISDMRALGPREFAAQRGRLILSKSATPEAVEEAMAVMVQVPEQGYLAAWEMMCRSDIFSLLDSRYPTMVVCGSDDPVSPPQTGQKIKQQVDGAEFHCLDGVGHYAAIEAPDRLNAMLRAFLSRN